MIEMVEPGEHDFPGTRDPADFFTSDCANGCGAWMGGSRSGGPPGVDPFGPCPNAEGIQKQVIRDGTPIARWKTYAEGPWELHHGEALEVLRSIPSKSVDAVITDPPYSSGGFTRGDKNQDPVTKYVHTGVDIVRASFAGDNRDARSWLYWCALWLSECARIVKDRGYVLMFSDWRQLPMASDAIQAGGFVWRGIVTWDKGEGARAPHTGYFRHQCEYIVWGTVGASDPSVNGRGPWAGCFRVPVLQRDKHHMTGKPTALLRELVRVVPPGGVVLDPFGGSCTTAVACLHEGRRSITIEREGHYVEIGRHRLQEDAPLFGVDASEPPSAGDLFVSDPRRPFPTPADEGR